MENVRYRIFGRTQKGKLACVAGFLSLKEVMQAFVKEFPRFNGNAEIRRYFVKEVVPGVFSSEYAYYEEVDSFRSTKEIKETYLANH